MNLNTFLLILLVVAETLNGRFAMLGLIAAVWAYLTTEQIIPSFV